MQVGLSLKIKSQIATSGLNGIYGFLKKVFFQHAGRTGERTQAAGAFRTTQIAGSRWFKRNGNRVAPLNWFAQQTRESVATPHL